jgi:hypothetical protein
VNTVLALGGAVNLGAAPHPISPPKWTDLISENIAAKTIGKFGTQESGKLELQTGNSGLRATLPIRPLQFFAERATLSLEPAGCPMARLEKSFHLLHHRFGDGARHEQRVAIQCGGQRRAPRAEFMALA